MISTVFFDLDGTLVNFGKGSLAWHGLYLPPEQFTFDFPKQVGFADTWCPKFWKPLENVEFWAGLEPWPDGMALLRWAETVYGPERIGILSDSAMPCAADGKRLWLDKHLPGYRKRAFFSTGIKEMIAAPCKLLVDDRNEVVDRFRKCRGHAILAPRPWNRRQSETKLGLFDPVSISLEFPR